MILSDTELLELHALCQAVIDDRATAAEGARLQQLLAASEEARRCYVRAMALSASLYEYAGEMQSEAGEAPAENEIPARGFAWVWAPLAAAALVAIGWWLSGTFSHPVPPRVLVQTGEEREVVARLSGAKDGQWSGPPPAASGELHRGQQLRLATGFAEIAFASGAVVMLEGPAALDLTSEWEAALRQGTLRAKVPVEAIGFRITNPEVEVVDLGTEFSMVAEEGGGTEVFVTKGAVETHAARGQEPLILRETQARRFAGAGVSEVRDREKKLRRLARAVALERADQPLGYLHWSFDEAGAVAEVESVGLPRRGAAAQFTATGGEEAGARWAGPFRQALNLGGRSYGHASLAALEAEGPRTAAFWLKLPAESELSEAGTVLAWPAMGEQSPRVEIGWNRRPAEGPLGALRVEMGRAFTVGATPLRDGRWHHIAVVLMPGRKAAKLQAHEYVDGRLESIGARQSGKQRNRRVTAAASPLLTIGASPGEEERGLRGALDELFLANRALAPAEIKNLIEHNHPLPATHLAAQ